MHQPAKSVINVDEQDASRSAALAAQVADWHFIACVFPRVALMQAKTDCQRWGHQCCGHARIDVKCPSRH
jgi:hypothetical protein